MAKDITKIPYQIYSDNPFREFWLVPYGNSALVDALPDSTGTMVWAVFYAKDKNINKQTIITGFKTARRGSSPFTVDNRLQFTIDSIYSETEFVLAYFTVALGSESAVYKKEFKTRSGIDIIPDAPKGFFDKYFDEFFK